MSSKHKGHSGDPGDIGYNGFLVSLFYLARIDIEVITDANLTVIFKNLLKKNAVTREKRVAELLSLLQEEKFDYKDENFVMVWLQLYPRIALDSSKTVRQLAHQIQATVLEKFGPREFSKYLKSSIPLMLQALFDDKSIASTCYGALLNSFNNDAERVNQKLWVVFHEQIVNYCRVLIVNESPSSITDERYETLDDVVVKYDRAVNGAIQMLLKLITMANKGEFFLSEESMSDFNEILHHDGFWDRLLTCAHGPTINVQLLKSYMQLLKAVFALTDKNDLLPFTGHVDDLKALYKLVSKKFIKHVKLQPPNAESANSSIVYSAGILQVWDTLSALTSFTGSESALKKSLKIRKNFWQLGGSKSYTRLKDYLKLGSCQSDPVYYLILKSFFCGLKNASIESDEDFTFLDFSSTKDAKFVVEKVLLGQYDQLRGYNAIAFKKSAADCVTSVLQLFDIKQSDQLFKNVLYTLLDGLACPIRANEKEIQKEAITQIAGSIAAEKTDIKELIAELVETLGAKPFAVEAHEFTSSLGQVFATFAQFLAALPEGAHFVDQLLDELLTKVAELYEPKEISDAFVALIATLKLAQPNTALSEFAETLPSFISPEFVDLPLQLFEMLIEKKAEIDLLAITEDLFTKLSTDSPDRLKHLFLILNRHNAIDFKTLESLNSDIHQYLVSLSKKPNRSSDEDVIVFAFLNHSLVIQNVLTSSLGDEASQLKIIENVSQSGMSVDELGTSINTLVDTALRNISVKLSQNFLTTIQDTSLVKNSIFKHIVESQQNSFQALAKFLSSNAVLLPVHEITSEINQSLNSVDLSMVSLANPLVQNIHLVEFPETASCELSEKILSIGMFLIAYVSAIDVPSPEIKVLVGLCGQYCQDYAFIMNAENSKGVVSELETQLTRFFLAHSSFQGELAGLVNGTSDENLVVGGLFGSIGGRGPYTPQQFYHARLLVLLLTPVFESMSLSDFDNLNVQYTKLAGTPLKLAVFLCSAVKFLTVSKKLDRIRQYVFGEVLGVKQNQILQSGTTWIALATNFLRVDSESISEYEVMPVHKWGMVINQIGSWLEGDIAYDSEFLPMRSLIAIFLTYLIPTVGADLPDKAWVIAVDLCLNNFSTAQIESADFELKYFSMRLFVVLNKYLDESMVELWEESRKSIFEELVDLMVNEDVEKQSLRANNTPVFLANELMERILINEKMSKAFVAEKADSLYDLLSNLKFLNLQRIATSFLHKYILETQEDLVIEYLLRKSNLGDSSENVSDDLLLPPALLKNIQPDISLFVEAVDNKEYSVPFKYLWSWVLLFGHLKDTTYSMKADYINQIKADGAIESLLNTIFSVVDASDNSFLKKLVVTPLGKQDKATPENCLIQNYVTKDGCVGEDLDFEVHFALVHVYFLSFQYLGSFVQQWFNEIRDLQLKKLVERFSVRYVSPILISKMLAEVDIQKTKLTERDENLTIKVNKVTNEIRSVYIIDEQTMEMVVKIPETFPLSNVIVEGPVRLGVKETQWKAWLLASQRVISLTNGSITDCIELFNRNVNLHFSGFEECAICYSILHQDHSLPSKVCPTCLNKFHAACLYKWFKSSGSSTCPLCRCAFNFKTARS